MKKKLSIAGIILVIVALLGIRLITGRQRVSEASVAKANIIGISIRNMMDSDRATLRTDKGVVITAIHANSIAEQQGLKPNDVIVAINDESIENAQDYGQILDKALMQKNLTFRVMRPEGEAKIRLNIEYAAAYNNLGNAYVKDKQYDQAIDAYQKALEIEPKFAEAYYNLGGVYAQQKKYDLAVEHYKKAIAHRQDFEAAYYKLTEVYNQQGKHEDAVRIYQKMLPDSPGDTITSDLKPVEMIHAVSGEIKRQLKISGTIVPQARVTVFPKVAGMVEQMKVDTGSRVKKGQVLAVIEHEELQLQVEQAEAAVAAAEAAYDQAIQLSEVRIMTQVVQARAGLSAAEAGLQQVRDLAETRMETQIEQARSALDALQANLEKIRRGAREEGLRIANLQHENGMITSVELTDAELALTQTQVNRLQALYDYTIAIAKLEKAVGRKL